MSMKIRFLFVFLFLAIFSAFAENRVELNRVEPMNWWVGMNNPNLQLLIYGTNISKCDLEINYPGVKINTVTKVESPNYLFVDLTISSSAKAGIFNINFFSDKELIATYGYQLSERVAGSAERKGFTSADAMYLIMPDRFANGDQSNDNVSGYLEKANRKEPYGRHGGDLKGILQHLDFVQEMGYTALWINPVLENNLEQTTYHGYAITDFYKVDPRFGSNEDYKNLTIECKKRGLKMIKDMVFNHCGLNHWWINDKPMSDWINEWPEFTRSYFRLASVSDPNASVFDRERTVKGWFDNPMPDLNLNNKFLLTYLIQNSIWWVEYAGLDGIRVDTYPYPDRVGMSEWGKAVMTEYPNFNIVGECWISSSAKTAFYQSGFPHKDGFDSHLPSVMDFPLHSVYWNAFKEQPGWDEGLTRLYNVLSEDFLYPNPNNILLFPDNHDVSRVYSVMDKDIDHTKMIMALVATVRGIPQVYYGTELLMEGDGGNHASLRLDFPGGWEGDKVNAFTAEGRTKEQNDMFNYISKLLNYRKKEPVLHTGKFTHWLPQDGVYVYSRSLDSKVIVVYMNNNEDDMAVETSRFNEVTNGFTKAKDVMTGKVISDLSMVVVPSKTALIVEYTK